MFEKIVSLFLPGLATELSELRRYRTQSLYDLPAAVCSVDQSKTINIWNRAMENLTRIESDTALGLKITRLPEPWRDLISTLIYGADTHLLRRELKLDSQTLYLNLHKASIDNPDSPIVIVVEDLTETHKLEEQLVHKERLASIGQLAAGVAHEIGNPITGIACLAQNLKLEAQDPSLKDLSDEILTQTERVSIILQSLISFAHGGKADAERNLVPVRIGQCVTEAIKLLSLQRYRNVTLTNECDEQIKVLGDPQRLVQVFVNVLSNAEDASEEGSRVIIRSERTNDEVAIFIEDEGHGLPAGEIDEIFEPFYTTKDPGQGTGLGLAIVSSIVSEHHGTIVAEPNEQKGTRITIRLPGYDSNH